jgi:Leucine-rich repeat (LRR) protein
MVTVNRVLINNSDFQFIVIDDGKDNLDELSISNSNIERMYFARKFDHRFEWNIQNSSLNSVRFKIGKLWGNLADLSQTQGFQNVIERFSHLEVNYSSCNLSELPNTYLETVTLDLSRNRLKSCKILYFTQILYLQYNLFETVNITVVTDQSEARIQYLDLSYNQITAVGTTPFIGLPNLLYLKLNKNRIVNIHRQLFETA